MDFTHKAIAARMTELGGTLIPGFRPVSRQKVDDVVAGRVSAQLEELDVWALALGVSREYLLGFTWVIPLRPRSGSLVVAEPARLF